MEQTKTWETQKATTETVAYEPPLLIDAGLFSDETRGGSGRYKEQGVGRFL
jgi:hypothetical protein